MTETSGQARSLRELAGIEVTRVRTLTARKAAALAEIGIESVFDLLTTYPYRYIDRSRRVELVNLTTGDQAVVLATVRTVRARRTRHGRSLVEVGVHDGTAGMTVSFFNQPWRARQLAVGTEGLFFGKLDTYRGALRMVNPVVDVVGGAEDIEGAELTRRRTMRIVPVYPASAKVGLSSWEIGRWVEEAVRRAGGIVDPLPVRWRQELDLLDRTQAIHDIHLPEQLNNTAPARRRLAFDELFRLQLALCLRRRALEEDARAIRHAVSAREALPTSTCASRAPSARRDATLVQRFLESLPFELTGAQRKAIASVFAEMAGPLPMHRLLQGDVGSGKTVVAVAAMLAAVQGGHQGALMVPTEVLAEQHSFGVRALVEGLAIPDARRLGGTRPVEVALLTSRTPSAERRRLREALESGSADIVVGTHALLTDDVRFHSLGAAVIDEQHRFGVEQRAQLRAKGRASVVASADGASGADPDLLVMTATPIPRTAAMVLFGDLDMVVLDEKPPGRMPVETVWLRQRGEEAEVWSRIREEAGSGRRAFVVCPLVEGSERVRARSAIDERERLAAGPLAGLRLGLLHGQMPASEKEVAMDGLRTGALDVLVATTVIEVGVDVPEATVMVIEDAARFGIAQLHQLRGRVGRGDQRSWCYLLGAADNEDAEGRLSALVRTTDGFELAEVDLDQRGEGTILGARQKGRSDLKLASVRKDADLLDAARRVAEDVTARDPHLGAHTGLADEIRLFLDPEEEAYLFKS